MAIIVFISTFAGCESITLPAKQGKALINAAVLYDSSVGSDVWEDTYSQLKQSLLLDFHVEAIDVSKGYSLEGLNLIYPDNSIMQSELSESIKSDIVLFTKNGGSVLLHNDFYKFFDKKFIGASKFNKIPSYPDKLEYPEMSPDLTEMQGLVWDFSSFYPSYADFDRLSKLDYGYAAVPSGSKVLVSCPQGALYTLNQYGKGYVLFTNKLLPNLYSVNGFSLKSRNLDQISLANTTASSNQIFLNAFASFVSKRLYGFSLSRVFGCFGRPSMAWELHFEEISGIANKSIIKFSELAKKYWQIPSYTLIRNSYNWFLRTESISYLLGNKGTKNEPQYNCDFNEGVYSSGTHIPSGNEWLNLAKIKNSGSYFEDFPEQDLRAYPCMADINGDAVTDIICGSSDGSIYIYTGIPNSERYSVSKASVLKDFEGNELKASGYSAPVLVDIDGNGYSDIVCGSSTGKIFVSYGSSAGFSPFALLLETPIKGQCFPELGNLSGNGMDLLVGSNEGKLLYYKGAENGRLQLNQGYVDLGKELSTLGTWLAPRIYDLDSDKTPELYIGTKDGYIAKTSISDDKIKFQGYLETEEKNYKGNSNIKFGNNCVPCFADINGDLVIDLVAGNLEYGSAYPIDSEYFPYRDVLQEQVDYLKANGFYVSPHFYTNAHASSAREDFELKAHLKALESYGITADNLWGTNQHTWFTSSNNLSQSFLSEYQSGLLWNSGFSPPRSDYAPQSAAENVINLPFFVEKDGDKTILLQNSSVIPYADDYWQKTSAKYGVPVLMFYHCDFMYQDEASATQMIEKAEAFRKNYNYNFVSEDQLMLAIAASYNLSLSTDSSSDEKGFSVTLTPGIESSDFPLYDNDYANSSGVKISLGEKLLSKNIATDASVWFSDGNDIYVSADRKIKLFEEKDKTVKPHLERINTAASINNNEAGWQIIFKDSGLLECVVFGSAETSDEGWTVKEDNGKTTFSKFGEAQILTIKCK